MKRIIVYDDYNQRTPNEQSYIGTITTNIGNQAPRNGYKLIEIVFYDGNYDLSKTAWLQ